MPTSSLNSIRVNNIKGFDFFLLIYVFCSEIIKSDAELWSHFRNNEATGSKAKGQM